MRWPYLWGAACKVWDHRPLITLTIIFILAGIQILTLGLVANYIGSIRKEMYKIQKQNKDLQKITSGHPAGNTDSHS